MIKFFKHIRKSLLMENKTSKYFKYAFGEILLVVIGILIALQINNWNEKRVEKNILNNYYLRMLEELVVSENNLKKFKASIDTLVIDNKRTLHILNLKNKDSLPLLKESLWALGTSYGSSFNFPILEEFINEGNLAKVKNSKIKNRLQAFSIQLNGFSYMDKYIENQYFTSIEPYFNKHINYAEVFKRNKKLVQGGPEIDYNNFYNNLELWNIVTFKLETVLSQQIRLESFIILIEQLKENLIDELDK